MIKFMLLAIFLSALSVHAQRIDEIINVNEVKRIESVLASDEMKGRKVGTPDIEKAANFIAAEFQKAGLQPLNGNSMMQEFIMVKPKLLSIAVSFDKKEPDPKSILIITSQPHLDINEHSGLDTASIRAGENFFGKVQSLARSNRNIIIYVDTSFSKNFVRLSGFRGQIFRGSKTMVFVLGLLNPETFNIKAEHSFEESHFSNVVGMLPGKSKKNDFVIFSGHYDHLGIGRPIANDSIYNGANDDAAGTTAVILLAKYFHKMHNNERSLIFVAFTAEEIGEFGSQYFSRQLDPAAVTAMFNVEMIGTESKWGKRSAYITGYDKTNMGAILQQNLKGSSFTFYPDPYTQQNLFFRSDNASLALLGVPAHTISTSKMDDEPYYHKPSDEISTLDLENMTDVIKAIAISSKSIVAGSDTPTRVKVDSLL